MYFLLNLNINKMLNIKINTFICCLVMAAFFCCAISKYAQNAECTELLEDIYLHPTTSSAWDKLIQKSAEETAAALEEEFNAESDKRRLEESEEKKINEKENILQNVEKQTAEGGETNYLRGGRRLASPLEVEFVGGLGEGLGRATAGVLVKKPWLDIYTRILRPFFIDTYDKITSAVLFATKHRQIAPICREWWEMFEKQVTKGYSANPQFRYRFQFRFLKECRKSFDGLSVNGLQHKSVFAEATLKNFDEKLKELKTKEGGEKYNDAIKTVECILRNKTYLQWVGEGCKIEKVNVDYTKTTSKPIMYRDEHNNNNNNNDENNHSVAPQTANQNIQTDTTNQDNEVVKEEKEEEEKQEEEKEKEIEESKQDEEKCNMTEVGGEEENNEESKENEKDNTIDTDSQNSNEKESADDSKNSNSDVCSMGYHDDEEYHEQLNLPYNSFADEKETDEEEFENEDLDDPSNV